MFVKSGTTFKVKNLEQLSKVAKKDKFYGYVKDDVIFSFPMGKIKEIVVKENGVLTNNSPIVFKGWRWYAWMLDIPLAKAFEIE